MGKIYYMMGKSSSGKDTLYGMLMKDEKLRLKTVVPYTTRPMRAGEENGVSYYFCDEDTVEKLEAEGKIIELLLASLRYSWEIVIYVSRISHLLS